MGGFLERFNLTLKHMLRNSGILEHWEGLGKMATFLAFANWEVPQGPTGFSQFELP